MVQLNDYDRTHVGLLINDPEQCTWTTAHILRFIDRMMSKGLSDYEMGTLYALWPDHFDALLDWYGWPDDEKRNLINRWLLAVG